MGLFNRRKKDKDGTDPGDTDEKKGAIGKISVGVKGGLAGIVNVGEMAAKGMAKGVATASDGAKGIATAGVGVISTVQGRKDAATDDEVGARTPADLWFTPSAGWPEYPKESAMHSTWKPPELLMPTEAERPFLYSNSAKLKPIGELRLEILEADGLHSRDLLSKPSPYCMVVFEGYAACTNAVQSTKSPRWPSTEPRAFAFPVTTPYSIVYICLRDSGADLHLCAAAPALPCPSLSAMTCVPSPRLLTSRKCARVAAETLSSSAAWGSEPPQGPRTWQQVL
jgi:hypothetical protein